MCSAAAEASCSLVGSWAWRYLERCSALRLAALLGMLSMSASQDRPALKHIKLLLAVVVMQIRASNRPCLEDTCCRAHSRMTVGGHLHCNWEVSAGLPRACRGGALPRLKMSAIRTLDQHSARKALRCSSTSAWQQTARCLSIVARISALLVGRTFFLNVSQSPLAQCPARSPSRLAGELSLAQSGYRPSQIRRATTLP